MRIFKRGLSFLLSLVLIFSMIPAVTQAEEEPQTQVSSGDMTVEGTNSLGTLLSEDVQEYQQTDETAGGYNVVDLTFENGIATAQFRTLETAILVAAVYTEDGVQLVTSGYAQVQPEESTVSITMSGEMPQYFMAAAYLVDVYDHSPLCTAYETVMYTQEMQELLASTVDDYAPELVLNLDDSTETNFAVYEETTIVIEEQTGVNTVASADDENAVYVIENADESITSLTAGDIFVLPYGEDNILIVKVASISIDGTTATVTGADVELEEVFSHVKLETVGNAADMTVDEATAEEGITFDGLLEEAAPATRGVEGDVSDQLSLCFTIKDKQIKADAANADASVLLNGSIELALDFKLNYYVSLSKQSIKLAYDVQLKAVLAADGKATVKFGLPHFERNLFGVKIGFNPQAQAQFNGEGELGITYKGTQGFTYHNGLGFKDLTAAAKVEPVLKLEGAFFVGVDLKPTAEIFDGKLFKAEVEIPVGLEVKSTLIGKNIEEAVTDPPTVHDCTECLSTELRIKWSVSVKLTFLKLEKLSLNNELSAVDFKIGEHYRSFDKDESGWGSCPYRAYRVTVQVHAPNDEPAAGVEVLAVLQDAETPISLGPTNDNGIAVGYLSAGIYTLIAAVDGVTYERYAEIGEACKLKIDSKSAAKDDTPFASVLPDYVKDTGVLASGSCGEGMSWKLDHDGTLTVSGNGAVTGDMPWLAYKSILKKVVIGSGVTAFGDHAFLDCTGIEGVYITDLAAWCNIEFRSDTANPLTYGHNLYLDGQLVTALTIPSGVTRIQTGVFYGCTSLLSVTFPDTVTQIGTGAFYGCTNLLSVSMTDSLQTIENGAFCGCTALRSLQLGGGVSSIGDSAFYGCAQLEYIRIPQAVTAIDRYAFAGCTGVTGIRFEGAAPAFGYHCFENVTAVAGYPEGDDSWTDYIWQSYGGSLTWQSYSLSDTAASTKEAPATRSIFGGTYDTETTDSYTLKSASFSGLVPGQEYVLLALVSLEADDVLAASNLLALDQGQAGEDGTLVFTYAQRVNTNISYVMACGASNKNLEAAEITFPFMAKSDTTRAVDPVVTYEGQVLTEGVDYTVVGTVDYTVAGTYTCYIRGIYNYTGLVECAYSVMDVTVTETESQLTMELNGDCAAGLTLEKDLYVDLNGYELSGTIITGGYKVYGMDSTTDSYSCDSIGYFSCTDENGAAIVPVQHFKTDSKRYMAIKNENGYSFHRFYLGITHMSLKPATTGVGYKAVFWGDGMVAANLQSFGFTMCLAGNDSITAELSAEKFLSGKVITLRLDNFDVDRFGETELYASAVLQLKDGTVIESVSASMTMRGLMERLNDSYTALTTEQLTAVADMLKKHAIITTWKVENLI